MQALILAGGSGTRFWPLSRSRRPKQLLPLDGERSLLRSTLERLSPLVSPGEAWISTTALLAEATRAELPEVPPEQVLVEPEGRNTAAAIAWSVRAMPAAAREGVIAVLPADHRVAEPEAFRATLDAARRSALGDRVVTLGVAPHRPETGFGYLELGECLDSETGLRRVDAFREKPDAETAARFAASGRHAWNAGIFVFRGTALLAHLARHAPQIAAGVEAIAAAPERTAELYRRLPSTSIDFALMEPLSLEGAVAALPLDCGWSDLGSWEAVLESLPADARGNLFHGDVVAHETEGCLLWSDSGTIATVGVRDLVVVRTADAVLVLPRERSQEVRAIVEALRRDGRAELL